MSHAELAQRMFQMAAAKLITKPLYAVAKLGVADFLAEGPRPVDELARETKTHAPTLYRVLRTLASVGLFREVSPRTFALQPLGELIRSGEHSMRGMVLWLNDPRHDHAFGHFMQTVETGATAVEHAHGHTHPWQWLAGQPDLLAIFQDAMTANSNNMHAAAVAAYDFSGIGTLVDVGGGHGTLLSRILTQHGELRGTVYDRPEVIADARKHIEARKLGGRCEAVGGDFFQSVPAGDAHIMSFILHDWYDDKAATILRNIARAQKPGGKLLLVELVVPPGDEPGFAKVLDIEMLAIAGGRERTEAEFRALLSEGGFELRRVIATHSPASVIEAVRV